MGYADRFGSNDSMQICVGQFSFFYSKFNLIGFYDGKELHVVESRWNNENIKRDIGYLQEDETKRLPRCLFEQKAWTFEAMIEGNVQKIKAELERENMIATTGSPWRYGGVPVLDELTGINDASMGIATSAVPTNNTITLESVQRCVNEIRNASYAQDPFGFGEVEAR